MGARPSETGSRASVKPASGLGPAGFDPARLPAHYSLMEPHQRRAVRLEYAKRQKGKCYHCGGDLQASPPENITNLEIDWRRFPPNFLRWPHHLHHDHLTDLTIGVVHAYCNAVLWQYYGE